MRSGMRLAAGLLGATVALTLSALPASAAGEEWTIGGGGEGGLSVNLVGKDNKDDSFSTGLIGLSRDKANLKTYCIQIDVMIPQKNRPKMVEAPWDAYPNPTSPFRTNNAKVNWVLHNSYP